MTETELAKFLFSNLPTVAIAIGVAKIYYRVTTFLEKIEKQTADNRNDIEILIGRHLKRHNEDALEFRKKRDG